MPLNSVLGGLRALLTIQVLSIFLLMGCSPSETKEKWIGYYQLPELDEKFPIYMQLEIVGSDIEGSALDGNLEVAVITGSVANSTYELNLHPVKFGSDTDQDVTYRAKRDGTSLTGEWEHSIDVKGPWAATMTEITETDAKQLLLAPCATDSKQNETQSSSVAA